ncbi:MAG: TlpA family protein disulfide reductase [Ruminococcaceae bacterium]|nr:TlpA family protein disulfide reductase [Oscillospiraceae bacterium]
MNKKIKLIIWIILFLFLIAGAYVLYDKLGEEYSPGGLVQDSQDQNGDSETTDNESSNDTVDSGKDEADNAEIPAPNFEVVDAEGNMVTLSDMIGKPVVVNFWASWCPPCKAEMPDFNEAYKLWGEDITFMMVNMTDGSRETVDRAKEFIESEGYEFPVYFDIWYSAAMTYGVYSLPATYFIDADGNYVAHAVGMIDADILEEGIGMIKE